MILSSVGVALIFFCAHYILAYHTSTALSVFFPFSFLSSFPLPLFCQISYTDKVGESKLERGYIYGYLQSKKLSGLKPQSCKHHFCPDHHEAGLRIGVSNRFFTCGHKQLIEWYNKGDLDFSKVTTINLDEYKGLGPDNDQSYRYFMNTNLFDHVNIDKSHTFVPDGLEPDPQKACAAYYPLPWRHRSAAFRPWTKWTYWF